jgi:hypothetical protein
MRAATVLYIFALLLFVGSSCAAQQSESLDLSDRIVDAAIRLKQGTQSETEVTHTLTLDVPSLVAIVSAAGVDRNALPRGGTDEQISGLVSAGGMWSGRAFVAITWSGGTSAGPTIERHVSVPQQLSVLKPARGSITVRLARDSSGTVSIADLR